MKAAIVGAGIGGLSAAIALALRGWEVAVYEQAPALTEVGAGVQIAPNGMRVLDALGVTPGMAQTLFEPEAIEMRVGRSGRRVFRLPMRSEAQARWGARYIHIHRADLIAALEARLNALAPGCITLGATVEGYTSASPARLRVNGAEVAADLIVGADGLHSVFRQQMLGPEQPRYTGNLAWRAVVPTEALSSPPPPTACVWVGQGCHAVTTRLRAGSMVNFVGVVETPAPSEESWRQEGDRADVAAVFGDWDASLAEVVAKAPVFHRWTLFDRAPLPRWSEGAVTLLGDAAHPMMPSMAQGAVQAMEDAWRLAMALAPARSAQDVPEALARFFKDRIARTSHIQRVSLANAGMFHRASPLGRLAYYTPMAIVAALMPGIVHGRQDPVYGYDAVHTPVL